MSKRFLALIGLSALLGCGDDVVRVFPLGPAPRLPHGHVSLVSGTLIMEMEESEALQPGYRWVAWASSAPGDEILGEITVDTRLVVDTSTLATPAADIEEVMITEEEAGGTLPSVPSGPVWMHGEFPGALQALGLDDGSFSDASAQVSLDKKHVEVEAAGLPALPLGFHYAVWLQLEGEHGDEHTAEPPMPTAVGRLSGGAFLENDLDVLAITALSAMVTIESERGVSAMSPATALHGEVMLSGEASTEPEAAAPNEHIH